MQLFDTWVDHTDTYNVQNVTCRHQLKVGEEIYLILFKYNLTSRKKKRETLTKEEKDVRVTTTT